MELYEWWVASLICVGVMNERVLLCIDGRLCLDWM